MSLRPTIREMQEAVAREKRERAEHAIQNLPRLPINSREWRLYGEPAKGWNAEVSEERGLLLLFCPTCKRNHPESRTASMLDLEDVGSGSFCDDCTTEFEEDDNDDI